MRPNALTIEMIVAITRISIIEKPFGWRVFKVALVFCLGLVMIQINFAVVQ